MFPNVAERAAIISALLATAVFLATVIFV